MKRLASSVIVLVLVACALASTIAAASAFWTDSGTLGLTTDYGATVRAVTPGGPAALAGIATGDRIRLDAVPFDQRRFVAGVGAPIAPGTPVDLVVVTNGAERSVHLTAFSEPLGSGDRWALLLTIASTFVFMIVGAFLIIARPSAPTWGFGLYCLIVLPPAIYPPPIASNSVALAVTFIYDVLQNIGVVGLVLFTLTFPRSFDLPWRTAIRRWLPALAIVLSAMTLFPDVKNVLLGQGASVENVILQLTFGVVFMLAIAILWDTYRRIEADERERMRWILIGFVLGLFASYIGNTIFFSTLLAVNPPFWAVNALVLLNVLLPLTVAHAVIRHRVLDINFVIGRALIFAVLTTLLTAVFALVDWFFGHVLEDFRLTRVLSAGISICFAFVFGRFEKAAENAIEALFFRKRHAAEVHVERSIHALPHSRSSAVIENAIVSDLAATLEIASAALFRRGTGDAFARTAAIGWSDADCAQLDDSDPLVLLMRAEVRPINVDEIPWKRIDVPAEGNAPRVAIPMLSHAELAGFVLYGVHPDGSELDPEEVALLERAVTAAGLAFDQLDAQRLRAENERLLATNADLVARLDEVRRR